MNLFKEIDVFGVYFPPFIGCLVAAGGAFLLVNVVLNVLEIQRYVWNRSLVNAAVFAILLALAVFLL